MEEKGMADEAAMIEAMARAICADDGFDQDAEDELAPLTANGTHQPHWVRYEDNAKAALAALRPYFAAIRKQALEEASAIPREAAARLLDGRKRVNQIDQHTAAVLNSQADAILALAQHGQGQ